MFFSDKEEAYSLGDLKSAHSAAQFKVLQDFFTRGINVEVLRPWNPEALVVAPADAVVQNTFSIKPDAQGFIRRHVVPQVRMNRNRVRKKPFQLALGLILYR